MPAPNADITIAQNTILQPIEAIAAKLEIPASALYRYGNYKAKLNLDYIQALPAKPASKLILVTAISPTPAGEGKTTTTIGLGDALSRLGRCRMSRACKYNPPQLTSRECEILSWVVKGKTRNEIADILGVPPDTIKQHLTSSYRKLNASNKKTAVMSAFRHGILAVPVGKC